MTGWEVSVPGSTSNFGSGFDVLGMAVNRRLTARLVPEPADSGTPLRIVRSGTLAHLDLAPEADYLAAPLLPHLGDSAWRLDVTSEIPFGSGMGSSAAARVAGEVLADLVSRGGRVELDRVFATAAAGEGHADNVAPSCHGGLLAVSAGSGGPAVTRLTLSDRVGLGYVAPGAPMDTGAARTVLPDAYPRDTVVRSLARVVRLIDTLADPGPDGAAFAGVFDDELHVPHRLPLIPGGELARDAGYAAGAWGVTISGAGSGMLVLADLTRLDAVLRAMSSAVEGAGAGPVTRFAFRADPEGVRWRALPAAD